MFKPQGLAMRSKFIQVEVSFRPRWLAGELYKGFFDADHLVWVGDQVPVAALRIWRELSETIRFDGDLASRREREVVPIGKDRVEHTGEVPGRALMRRRVVKTISLR